MAEINTDWLYSEKLAFKVGAGQDWPEHSTTFAEEQDRDRSIFLRARPDIVQRLRKAYEDARREIPAWLSDYPSLPQEKILLPTAPTTEPSPVVPQEDVTGRPDMGGLSQPSVTTQEEVPSEVTAPTPSELPATPEPVLPQEGPTSSLPQQGAVEGRSIPEGPRVGEITQPEFQEPLFDTKAIREAETSVQVSGEPPKYTMPTSKLSGSDYKDIQSSLNVLGFSVGSVDGDWGPKSRAGLEAYQKSRGLEVTGNMNQETYEQMSRDLNDPDVQLTMTSGPNFYRAPKLEIESDVETKGEGKDFVGGTPWQSWTFKNGKKAAITGKEYSFDIRGDERSIIFLDEVDFFKTGAGSSRKKVPPKRIVFHNTAKIYGDKGVAGFMDAASVPQAHFFIDRKGQIYQLWDPEIAGQHAANMNTGSIGIEVEGFPTSHEDTGKSFKKSDWTTPEQHAAAAWLGEYLLNKYSTIEHVVSHREIGYDREKKGPSRKVDGWKELQAFRNRMGMKGTYGMNREGDTTADSSSLLFFGDTSVWGQGYFGQSK